jgi:hypothetical protein
MKPMLLLALATLRLKGKSQVGSGDLTKALASGLDGNDTYEKNGGIPFTGQDGQGQENSTAKHTEESVNIDLILAVNPSAGPRDPGFDFSGAKGKILESLMSNNSTSNNSSTSDKEIIQNSTGSAQPVDANAQPLPEGTWIPGNLPEGSPITTRNGDVPHVKGDTLLKDSVPKRGNVEGYKGYYRVWKIQNANRNK